MAKEFKVNTLNLSGVKFYANNIVTTGQTGSFLTPSKVIGAGTNTVYSSGNYLVISGAGSSGSSGSSVSGAYVDLSTDQSIGGYKTFNVGICAPSIYLSPSDGRKVDLEAGTIVDQNSVTSVDWLNRNLTATGYDTFASQNWEGVSVNWQDKILTSTGEDLAGGLREINTVDWQNCLLSKTDNLKDFSETIPTLNWQKSQIYGRVDMSQFIYGETGVIDATIMDWSNPLFIPMVGAFQIITGDLKIGPVNSIIFDSSVRVLCRFGDSWPSVAFGDSRLLDANIYSVDWVTRRLYDSNGGLTVDWNEGQLYQTPYGSKTLDWNNSCLFRDWTLSGSLSIDTASGWVTQYPLEVIGNIDNYFEIDVYNLNTGVNASSDIVASNSTDETNDYVNLGINSKNYTGAMIGYTGDGYCYNLGGDFYIGNATTGRKLCLFAGGPVRGSGEASQSRIIITNNSVGINNSSPVYSLDVIGNGNFSSGLFVSGQPIATNIFNTKFQSGLQANITMTNANTFYGALSGTLASGTYLVNANAVASTPSVTAARVTAKLWNGSTTTYAAGESSTYPSGLASTGVVNISLNTIISITTSTTIQLTAASTAASCILRASTLDNLAGTTGYTTTLNMLKLY